MPGEPRVVALGPTLPPDIGPPFARLATRPLPADERGRVLADLLPRLEAIIGARVDGLVLYGSARRVDDPGDIDALLTTDGVKGGLWGDAGGHELDIFCEPLERVLAGPPGDWPHLARGAALYDPSGELTPFIERVAAHRAAPAPAPSPIDAVQLPVWARRQLARIRRRRDVDPALAAMHRAGLVAMLPRLWTIARHAHGTSPTDWMRQTRQTEPALAPHLDALADPLRVDAALEAIVEALFPTGRPPPTSSPATPAGRHRHRDR